MKRIKLIFPWLFVLIIFLCNPALSTDKDTGSTVSKKIDLGAIVFLTGAQSFLGKEVQNAMIIAKHDIEKRDNVKFNIIFKDSGDSPKNALTNFRNLNLMKLPVILVTGDVVSLSLIPEADRTKTVLYSIVAGTPGIPQKIPWVFRAMTTADAIAKTMAEYAISNLDLKRVSILSINNQFGLHSANNFQSMFEGDGRKIIHRETFEISDRDLRNQIIKIKVKEPDGVFVTGFGNGYSVALRQLKEYQVNATILTDTSLSVEYFQKQAGSAAEGVYFISTLFGPDSKNRNVIEFIKNYNYRFKKSPSFVAAIAYDSTMMIYNAIKMGGFTNKGIRKMLIDQSKYNGLLGEIDISLQREMLIPLVVKKIKNGKEIVVSDRLYYW